jgi:hypothetical protein
MALDAFGRLRTSDCFTTFNYYPSAMTSNTTLDIDVWVPGATGGAQSYNTQNYIDMPISGPNNTYSLRTTKQPMIYQPGKSRLIYMTGVLMTTVPPISGTVSSHMGIFTVDNTSPIAPNVPAITQGTYLKTNGINFYWEDVEQGPTIESVIQTSWNIDTFNGSGPSGKTLTVASNANKNLLIVIDQEWLGVGRIRCGFIIDGVIYYAHQFLHNGMDIQYTNTPRLNLSYLITGNSANSMRQMCSTNISEGGYFSTGRINNVNVPISGLVNVNTTNNRVLLGLRIQSGFPTSTFYIKQIFFYYTGGGGKYAQYKVQMFSTNGSIGELTGTALTFTSLTNSSIEYCIGNGNAYVSTEGFVINSGYLDTQSSLDVVSVVNDSLQTRNLFTKYDTLYITGIASAIGTMGASLDFIEDI